MRLITLFCMMIICMAAATNVHAQSEKLNGTWIPISQEMNGKAFPKSMIENQKLIINDSNYTVVAESVDKGMATFNNNKIDIYGKDGINAGKHFTAIYKFENNQLIICYNLKGDSYPDTFDTNGKPLFFLSVFKKQ